MRKKVILAAIFAAEVLSGQGLTLAEEAKTTDDSIIAALANNNKAIGTIRAYYLVHIAEKYLAGVSEESIDQQYKRVSTAPTDRFPPRWMSEIKSWTEQLSQGSKSAVAIDEPAKTNALKALKTARKLLSKSTNEFYKLNLLLAASIFFERLGDKTDSLSCLSELQAAMTLCEIKESVHPEEAKGLISVLDSMAYEYVPLHISEELAPADSKLNLPPKVSCSEANFRKAEQLKLRGITIADRLAPTEDARRMAHRNLALWYERLDKKELAEQQKKVLYKLVGINDERILQPHMGGCGHLSWWTINSPDALIACGMG